MKPDDIKQMVKKKYGEIAKQGTVHKKSCSCCGPDSAAGVDYTVFSEDYTQLEGYNPEADLGLGCGIPTGAVEIRPGDTVVDLGSGAGNDVFVARRLAGESGRVIGIDMTQSMIERARENNSRLGYRNVEFRFGEIEALPVDDNTADVVISNCVLNLVPDKLKAYKEIFRVLKPGGCFGISDVVLTAALPANLQAAAEMYAGCVAGALVKEAYLSIIRKAGFPAVSVVKEKAISLPDEMLSPYLSAAQLREFRISGPAILSITVRGEKAKTAACGCCG
jgi:arsenite methyltransferase